MLKQSMKNIFCLRLNSCNNVFYTFKISSYKKPGSFYGFREIIHHPFILNSKI